jgi:hypothetical protein
MPFRVRPVYVLIHRFAYSAKVSLEVARHSPRATSAVLAALTLRASARVRADFLRCFPCGSR